MRAITKGVILAGALIVFAVVALKGAAILIPTGTWVPQTNLSSARANASAALLQDGRVLITGGDSGSGPVATADFFAADGTISAAPPMVNARSKHVAVTLLDGRVLVAGGITGGGSCTSTAEVYDPATNSWTSIGTGMTEARSSASAALLADGRVVIAGGQNGSSISSTIEIFDPVAGSFSFVGTMSSPRTQDAMAVLQDGRVIITGGSNGTSPVASTDIFDPVAGTIGAGPNLAVARFGHSATTLLDGQVVVIGGNNGNADPAQMDLASAELFDPPAGTFTTLAANMATPREGHLAILLPNNNNVLIVGGMSGGAAIAAAELFMPQESSQGAWTYGFGSTDSMSTARSNATGSANQVNAPTSVMQRNGVVMVAGGNDASGNALTSTEAYGYATIQTDQGDYPPGTTVTITGSGWKPGETVNLELVESPLIDTHGPFSAVADANGNIQNASFVPNLEDIGVRFYLTAVGQTSRYQALTTFTDNKNVTVAFASTGSGTVVSTPAGMACTDTGGTASGTCVVSVGNTAQVTLTATSTSPSTIGAWTVPVSYTINSGCTSGSTTCTFTLDNSSQTVTLAFNPGAASQYVVKSSNNSPTAGAPVTITAQLADSGGNPVPTSGEIVTWSKTGSGGSFGSPTSTTNASGVATVTFTTAATVTTYTVTATDNTLPTNLTGTSGNIATVAGTASQLLFQQQPTNTVAGVAITPAITVNEEDANGNVLTGDSSTSITIAILNNPGGGTLSGTTSQKVSNGIATFNDLSINNADTGYTLQAKHGTLTAATSSPFNITAATVATTLTLNSVSPNSVPFGSTGPVTFSGTLTRNDTSAGVVGATVNFSVDGGAAIPATTGAGGVATVTTYNPSALSVGPHNVAASFTAATISGTSYLGSSSGTLPLTVSQKTVTANVTASNKTYDRTSAATITSCTLNGVLTGDVGNVGCSALGPNTFSDANVGNAKTVTATGIALSGAAAGNYTLNGVTTATTTANITTAALTATLTAANKTYDSTTTEPDASMSCSVATVFTGDTVTCAATSGNFNSSQVATATQVTATVTISGTSAGNYTLGLAGTSTNSTSAMATAQITTAALTATLTAANKTYDSTTTEPDASMSCSVATVFTGDTVTCAATSGNFNSSQVATATQVTATVTISGTSAGNYTLGLAGTSTNSTSAMATAHITTAALTATLTAANKTYDSTTTEPDASMSCSVATVFTGDTVTCAATSGNFNSSQVATATQVTATVTISGASAGNYTLGLAGTSTNSTSAMATAQITTAALTATLTAANKTYDSTTTEPDASMSCSVATVFTGDTVTCAATSGNFNSSQVATATQVTATVTISGASAGNYTLGTAGTSTNSTSAMATAQITTAALTATLTAANKTYDGTATEPNANLSCSVATVFTGDTVNCAASSGTFNSSQVATATQVTATVTISGASAGNYTLGTAGTSTNSTSAMATAQITTAALTATLTAANKTYDGTATEPNANLSCSVATVFTGDTVNCAASSGTFNTSQVATATQVTATVTIGGASAGNYTLGLAGTSLNSTSAIAAAHINPAPTSTSMNSSANPSTDGQSVTFTATVMNTAGAGVSTATPTGSVQFVIDGSNFGSPVPVAGSGATATAASLSTTTLTVGPHSVVATYTNSDGNFVGSMSSTFTQQVNYGFLGLQSPYMPPPTTFNVKRTMPLKWQYTNSGGAVVNSASANPVVMIQGPYACGTANSAGDITVSDAGASGYQYDSTTNTWQFNWQVKGNAPGCYDIFIKSQQSGQTNGAFPINVVNQ